MIRWYDYIAAFIAADFLLANFMMAMTGPNFWVQLLGGLFVAFIWDAWNDLYCKFRLNMEMKR